MPLVNEGVLIGLLVLVIVLVASLIGCAVCTHKARKLGMCACPCCRKPRRGAKAGSAGGAADRAGDVDDGSRWLDVTGGARLGGDVRDRRTRRVGNDDGVLSASALAALDAR